METLATVHKLGMLVLGVASAYLHAPEESVVLMKPSMGVGCPRRWIRERHLADAKIPVWPTHRWSCLERLV